MNPLFKRLICIFCILLLAAAFTGCGPKTPETSASPGGDATPGTTDSATTPAPGDPTAAPVTAKYMKSGETYRVLICTTTEENEWLNQEGIRGQLAKESYDYMIEQFGVTPLWIAAPADWLGETLKSTYAGSPITELFHFGGPFTLPTIYTFAGEKGATIESLSDYDIDFTDPEYWDQTTQMVGTFGGKQYIVAPNAIGFDAVSVNVVTFFNKSLIQKGGYTAEQLYDWSNNGEWTFDKFREVAKNCTDPDNGIYGVSTNQNCLLMSTMIASNGSDMFVKKDGLDTFNMLETKAMKAINYLVSMARDDKSVLVDISSEEAQHFASGMLSMMVTYVNRLDVRAVKRMADDFGILMPPKGPDATDYISDKNWFVGYLVMKNINNPAGAFEFASYFLKPAYPLSSELQSALLSAQAAAYRLDEPSVEILKKVPAVNHTTPYMIFWQSAVNGETIANACNYQFPGFVDGSLSPETYYASIESVANNIIATTMGGI